MVDIVIPSYNRCQVLQRAVASVLNQTEKNWKLFIVDDGSSDGTSAWLDSLTDPRIESLKIPNSGVSVARNRGAALGRSTWIAFLDSDDEWTPDKLHKCLTGWDQESPIIHTQETWKRDGDPQRQPLQYRKKSGQIFNENVERCSIGPSTVLIKRSLWEQEGGFNESFPICEDQELWLRLCKTQNVCLIDEELTVKHGGHTDQLSRTPLIEEWRLKALLPYASDADLPQESQLLVRQTLLKKCQILARGYEKYGHSKKLRWIIGLQQELA